jgi:hypothetical protein
MRGVFPRTRRSGGECADPGLGHRQVRAPDADDRGHLQFEVLPGRSGRHRRWKRCPKAVPFEELVLRAKILPAGEVRITTWLRAIEDGCRVEMDEVAISGPPKYCRVSCSGAFSHRATASACGGWRTSPSASSPTKIDRAGVDHRNPQVQDEQAHRAAPALASHETF